VLTYSAITIYGHTTKEKHVTFIKILCGNPLDMSRPIKSENQRNYWNLQVEILRRRHYGIRKEESYIGWMTR
jgi:hypothetical protein